MLCDVCGKLGLAVDGKAEPIVDEEFVPHHSTWRSLRRSVSLGCYVCSQIWESLSPAEQRYISNSAGSTCDEHSSPTNLVSHEMDSDSDFSPETSTYWTLTKSPDEHILYFGHSLLPTVKYSGPCSFVVRPVEEISPTNVTLDLSDSTRSTKTFSLARGWVRDCITNHSACKAASGNKIWYPSRLLDCSNIGDPEAYCRLVETLDADIQGPYMTLSHCWGDTDCLKLTTENHAQMLRSIPLSNLPQLYRDAVLVTRAFGVKYLWIDSLCIVQGGDQLEDWLRQVKIMDQIYLNSFCNVSAANARNGHCTMFSSRRPELVCPPTCRLNIDGAVSSYFIMTKEMWRNQVSEALINTRGWVLQERLLSPRVLYFGDSQILWECNAKAAAEIYPEDAHFITHEWEFSKPLLSLDLSGGDSTGGVVWPSIVYAYSRCHLSVPHDKLTALSAIAKYTRLRCQDEYVVGMWRRTLGCELLWWTRHRDHTHTRPDRYRAPSWSWTSLDGPICPGIVPDFPSVVLPFEIVDLEINYQTDDVTGPVSGGSMRLLGAMSSQTIPSLEWSALSCEYLDPPHEDSKRQDNAPQTLYYFPLIGDQDRINTLLLEVVDKENGVYRRVGVAQLNEESVKDLQCREDDGSLFPCEEYKDGKYLIKVI